MRPSDTTAVIGKLVAAPIQDSRYYVEQILRASNLAGRCVMQTLALILAVTAVILFLVIRRQGGSSQRSGPEAPRQPSYQPAQTSLEQPPHEPKASFPELDPTVIATQTGWFREPIPGWLTEALQASESQFRIAQVRGRGDPVDKETKKALGMRANTRLGTEYLAALTEKGKREAAQTAIPRIRQRAFRNAANAATIEQAQAIDGATLTITYSDEAQPCQAVREWSSNGGKAFQPNHAPALPITGCDSDECKCLLAVIPE